MKKKGKKTASQECFYGAMKIVTEKTGNANPLEIFSAAMNNVKPVVEVKSKRVGGATYQVPVEVNRKRAQSLAIRWILEAARGKKGRPMSELLANELLYAFKNEGSAMTKLGNTHK